MAITAASVEANGWVLRLTLTGSLSSAIVAGFSTLPSNDNAAQWNTNLGAYSWAPNTGMPMTLAMASNGFVQSGGIAVASATVGRTLTATRPLRKVVISGNAAGTRLPQTPDEVDNGDGTITVRLALSQHVYAGDSGLTLTVAASWRTGSSAQTITVTNASTVAAPAPIVRWSDVPYQLQAGSFTLECVAVSHHPNGLAPVAGVRFTVTDGTTVKTFWSTALSTSTAYSAGGTGLPLRVYSVTVDPTTATALTQGLLRCDFEVYPWVGPVQKSDVAGTRSLTGIGTAAFATNALVPFVVAYNPGGAWITPRYVDVDEINGSATAASVTVATTPAGAAAGTPANSINTAVQALSNLGVTVAAANGQAAITKSIDGAHIRLRKANAGTGCTGIVNGAGTVGPATGVQSLATWVVVEGDPADATARACVLRSPAAAAANNRLTRIRLTNLSIEAQTNACLSCVAIWADNFEVRAVTGQTATSGPPIGANLGQQYLTNGKWWQHGSAPAITGSTVSPLLIRNVAAERSFGAQIVANCARLATGVAGVTGAATGEASATGLGNIDGIVIGCDLRYISSARSWVMSTLANSAAPANLTLGTANPVRSRQAFINNVCEQFGGVGSPMWNEIGENNLVTSTEVVIEGNTFTGDRTNTPYSDLNLATIALNDSSDSLIRVYRMANNIMMKSASKHDAFNDQAVQSQRIGAALTTYRSKAKAVGDQIVVSGSPAQIYQCAVAGTTASTGGPTGTASGQVDGTVTWNWVASESRQHGYRPNAIGAWPSYYGVGAEGDVDLEPANVGVAEFQFAFFGLGSDQLSVEGISVTSTPFTNDLSGGPNRMPFQSLGSGGGNYKPLSTGAGVYALARARTANVDTDGRGGARGIPFAAGSVEGGAAVTAIVPTSARSASRAASPPLIWSATLSAAAARMSSRAATGRVDWGTALAGAATRLASRASSGAVGWATTIGVVSARSASRALSGAVGWVTTIGVASARSASRAAAGMVGGSTIVRPRSTVAASRAATTVLAWAVGLAVNGARSASVAAGSVVVWSSTLAPAKARSPSTATASVVGTVSNKAFAPDRGRIAVVDRTLPAAPSLASTPPDRTQTTAEFTTLVVAGSPRLS